MRRLVDWRARLTAYLAQVSGKSFRPGRHDCALFVAGAVEAMTGVDHARGWRGYRSLATGQKKLEARGFADHIALIANILPEVSPIMAQVGDLAVVESDGDQALGIVQGAYVYVLRPDGAGLVLLTDVTRAFRV